MREPDSDRVQRVREAERRKWLLIWAPSVALHVDLKN